MADSWKQAKRIRYAALLLDRIVEYRHTNIAYKFHYDRWGYPEWVWKDTEDGMAEFVEFKYPNAMTEGENEAANAEGPMLARLANYLEDQDYEQLFDILRRYLRGWWT